MKHEKYKPLPDKENKLKPSSFAESIIYQFGGALEVSEALKLVGIKRGRIAVWRWARHGQKIPPKVLEGLVKAARLRGFILNTSFGSDVCALCGQKNKQK